MDSSHNPTKRKGTRKKKVTKRKKSRAWESPTARIIPLSRVVAKAKYSGSKTLTELYGKDSKLRISEAAGYMLQNVLETHIVSLLKIVATRDLERAKKKTLTSETFLHVVDDQ